MKINIGTAEMEHVTKMLSWLVVMRVVHIDASREDAAKTGLFGLLGDALVQVVDFSEEKRVNAFFELMHELQREGHVTHYQNLKRARQHIEIPSTDVSAFTRNDYHPCIRRLSSDYALTCGGILAADEDFRPSPEPSSPPQARTLPREQGRAHGRVRGRVV